MRKVRNTKVNLVNVHSNTKLSDEKIARFIDGDLSCSEKEEVLNLLIKNNDLRRRVSDYVKFKRYKDEENEVSHNKVPPALTEKAISLFRKVINASNNKETFKPIYINYSQNEYEITGIIQQNNQTLLNFELHIRKNGQAYKGEVYIYKGKVLHRTLKVIDECITCDVSTKGNYHLYIKDDIIKNSLDLEFEIK